MHEHGAQDTLAVFTKEAVCIYVSLSCEKVTGIPQEKYLGSNWFDWVHPDDLEHCREKYEDHLSQATAKTEMTCRLINSAGDINHIHFAVSGHMTSEVEELAFVGVFSSRNNEVLSVDKGPASNSQTLSQEMSEAIRLASVEHQMCRPKSVEAPQIFLGGTCGNSRWRIDEAIPLLEEAGCSYYNPQLAPGTWTPDLIPIEQRAKEHADCLLFVITPDTRGVASMVEATEILSSGRSMVLVLSSYQQLEDLEPSSVT